ncbi:response regulator transcription factor [Nostoc sp. NIES-2111]
MVLADDHPVVLAGVKSLLAAACDIKVVGEAEDGLTALRIIASTMPDVAVIDIAMPGLNGVELARKVQDRWPDTRLLVLSVHEDRAYVQPLLQCGVRGYLLKRSAAEDLLRAVRAIAQGGIFLDPAIAEHAIRHDEAGDGKCGALGQLSTREIQVIKLNALGFSNKEIARKLEVSVKTVETYKARATSKLDLKSRADIVRLGVEAGWLESPKPGCGSELP